MLNTKTMFRTDMNETAPIKLILGWYFTFASVVSGSWIPVVLSSIASIMAIVNYYYQIKKNRTK